MEALFISVLSCGVLVFLGAAGGLLGFHIRKESDHKKTAKMIALVFTLLFVPLVIFGLALDPVLGISLALLWVLVLLFATATSWFAMSR